MENTHKTLPWNNLISIHIDKVWPNLIVSIVLIVILVGLTAFNPFLGIMSVMVLFLTVLVMSRPVLIVYGLIIILPLTDGLSRGSLVPFLRLGQALLVLGFILFLLANPSPLGKSHLTVIDLVFVLFFLSEAIFPVLALYVRGEHLDLNSAGSYYNGSPLQTLLGPFQYYLVYRIVVATITTENQIAMVLKLSFIVCIIVSVIGILGKFVAPVNTLIQTYYPPIDWKYAPPDYAARIGSTMGGFTPLASYLTATLIVALACSTVQKGLKISPMLLTTTLLSGSMALLLTGTFAGFFGFAVGGAIIFILFRRLPKWLIIALAGMLVTVLTFQSFISYRLADWFGAGANQGLFPTYGYRIMLWKDVFFPAIGQNLLFGAGPAPAALNAWPTEETQYLALLLRGGLPYFFSYFLLMGVAMVTCRRRIKRKNDDLVRTVAIATLAILVAINVMNVSSLYFTYPGVTQTLFILLAIVAASEQFETLEQRRLLSRSQATDGKWEAKPYTGR